MKKYSSVDMVDAWVDVAQQLGCKIRYDHFGGTGGGLCEFGGSRVLFLDVSLSTIELLEQLEQTLGNDPLLSTIELPEPLASSREESFGERAA